MQKINKEDYYNLLWEKKMRDGLAELEVKRKQFIEDTKKFLNVELYKRLKNNNYPVGDIEHRAILEELLKEFEDEQDSKM